MKKIDYASVLLAVLIFVVGAFVTGYYRDQVRACHVELRANDTVFYELRDCLKDKRILRVDDKTGMLICG